MTDAAPSDPPVFTRLCARLDAAGAEYDVLRHEPVETCEQAAAVRGTPLGSGSKALLCKGDGGFVLCVLPADRPLRGNAVRRLFKWRKLRFANADELDALTGLLPGSVPPFGSLFELPTVADAAVARLERMNFNAGDRGISLSLDPAHWLAVERPQLADIAGPAPG